MRIRRTEKKARILGMEKKGRMSRTRTGGYVGRRRKKELTGLEQEDT